VGQAIFLGSLFAYSVAVVVNSARDMYKTGLANVVSNPRLRITKLEHTAGYGVNIDVSTREGPCWRYRLCAVPVHGPVTIRHRILAGLAVRMSPHGVAMRG